MKFIGIIAAIIIAGLIEWIIQRRAAKPEMKEGWVLHKMPGIFIWFGYFTIFIIGLMLWFTGMEYEGNLNDVGRILFIASLLTLTGFLILAGRNHSVSIHSSLVEQTDAFGKVSQFAENEILEIRFIPYFNYYRIVLSDFRIIYINYYLKGIEKEIQIWKSNLKLRKSSGKN
ncbi:MAG: hypothetical protein KG003_14765 [Bacteroidetes bacterium]|nr:hypothetical protein [Bacteroidota bacterium]